MLVGREDPLGRDRRSEADRGKACAGKSTLNRLELSSVTQDKYRKTPVDEAAVEAFLVEQHSFRCEAGNRRSWCWIWMRRMIHCTESRRVVSTMATTGVTATCRCMLFCEGYVLGGQAAGVESGWFRRSGPGDGADRGTTAGEVGVGEQWNENAR